MASFGGLQIDSAKSILIYDSGVVGTFDYTVPAGKQLLITDIAYNVTLTNNTGTSYFSINHAGSTGQRLFYGCAANVDVAGGTAATTHMPTSITLAPGDRLRMQAWTAGKFIAITAVLQANS